MTPNAPRQDPLLEKALRAHSGKKLKYAITKYKKVLKTGPNVSASNGLSIALRELGLFKEALSVIESDNSINITSNQKLIDKNIDKINKLQGFNEIVGRTYKEIATIENENDFE